MAITDFIYIDDLETLNGDLLLEESEQSHIKDIIESNKGEYRQNALVGVGILAVLNGTESLDSIRKRIEIQLKYDNFVTDEIDLVSENNFIVKARQKVDL